MDWFKKLLCRWGYHKYKVFTTSYSVRWRCQRCGKFVQRKQDKK